MAKAEGHKNRGESNQQMAHKLQQAQAEIIVLKQKTEEWNENIRQLEIQRRDTCKENQQLRQENVNLENMRSEAQMNL